MRIRFRLSWLIRIVSLPRLYISNSIRVWVRMCVCMSVCLCLCVCVSERARRV